MQLEFNKILQSGRLLGDGNVAKFDKEIVNYIPKLTKKVKDYNPKDIKMTKGDNKIEQLLILPKAEIIVLDNWKEIAKEIAERKSELYNLSWEKFEDIVGRLLEQYGWNITPLGRTKDGGIDLIASQNLNPGVPFRMMVQCKRYSKENKVGLSVVKEVFATKWEKGFHQAMIATTSYFTRGAVEKGEIWDMQLRDHDNILDWCKDVGKIIT